MTESYKENPGGWHKEHTYTIRFGPVRADEVEEGRRFWATLVEVTRQRKDQKPTWVALGGYPEEKFVANTEAEAFNNAHEAAKAWIDEQDSN